MTYRVLIDGIDRTTMLIDDGFTIAQVESGIRRATIKLYEQLYSLGDELKIYVNDVLKFQGDIDKEMVRPGEFTAFASDLLIVLPDENVCSEGHYEYVNQDYTLILKDLLDYYCNGVFDVTNVDTTGMQCGHINLQDKQLSDAVKIIAKRSQHVFWLEPPNILYFKEKGTVGSGYTAIYGTNIEDINIIRDTFTKTKVVIRMRVGSVTVGTGSRIAVFADDTITTEDEAEDVGNAILEEMQDVQIRGELTLAECRHDIVPGTTIQLEAPQFGFNNEPLMVKSVTYSPFKTRLVIGTLTAMIEGKLVDFEDRIRNIENRGISWLFMCQAREQTMAVCGTNCEQSCQITCETIAGCVTACQEGECQSACQDTDQVTCLQFQQICGEGGVCQAACQAGHGCELTCQIQCQESCQTQCQVDCQHACQGGCETTCQGLCETSPCQIICEVTCEVDCEIVCNAGCEIDCQTGCETTPCQTGCETTCEATCETSCQIGCEQQLLCCGTIGPI